jgi:serine/threonine protein kinase
LTGKAGSQVQYKKLGRYELLRVLGKGAMGVVYEGRDPNLDRRVAIKTIMVDDLGPDAAAEYEARFRIEARSAARLQHPNIVTVYDSDRHGDTAYLVMEFIQGEDLKHHLDRGLRPTPEQALHLICDLLAALDFAHRQGVVHRDIKPANLLIEADGRVKLTDFGVARISGEATRTQGSMIGTLKYMAPEQVQGQKVDTRADLFSAAVVAYQLLTGVRPFEGDNDFTIIHQIIGQTPAQPSTLQPSLPPGTDDVLLRALAKNRDDRYQTAGEFSAALQAAFGTTVPGLTTQPGRAIPGFAAAVAAGPQLLRLRPPRHQHPSCRCPPCRARASTRNSNSNTGGPCAIRPNPRNWKASWPASRRASTPTWRAGGCSAWRLLPIQTRPCCRA